MGGNTVPTGRPFIAYLYLDAIGDNTASATLSQASTADLGWWEGQLQQLIDTAHTNGAAWVRYSYLPIPTPVRIYSDASGDMALGFGLIIDNLLIQGRWCKPAHTSSAYLEYIPLLHLLRHHGEQLQGSVIVCHTDNAGNALAINLGSTLAATCRDIFRRIHSLATQHGMLLLGD